MCVEVAYKGVDYRSEGMVRSDDQQMFNEVFFYFYFLWHAHVVTLVLHPVVNTGMQTFCDLWIPKNSIGEHGERKITGGAS
jgi:hypothetical protein